MILRKPYAFFIKYFKIIHLIMTFFMGLLIFQTNNLLIFFNNYVKNLPIVIGQDLISETFLHFIYVYIVMVLLMDLIVWILLDFKAKKRLFYIINFAGYIALLVLYVYCRSLLKEMSVQVIDLRLLMTIRDFVIIAFSFQSASIFIMVLRFLGLDIKKFNFESDIKELNLSDSDNEEFEVNFEVDSKKIRRNFKATMRNFKYYFQENLRLIIPILLVTIGVVTYFIYVNVVGNVTVYKQNSYFNVQNYSLKISEVYTTNYDYKMNSISDTTSLVVLKTSIKTTNNTKQFLFGKFYLKIGGNKYYHTIKYSDSIYDIGNTYIKQNLTDNYQDYLLVYEIPKEQLEKNMQLIYVNSVSHNLLSSDDITKINLKITNIDIAKENHPIILGTEIILNKSMSDINKITFNDIQIKNTFNINYKFCVNTNECYSLYEPLQSKFYGSYDKALIKIDMSASNGETIINDAKKYIIMFGSLHYEVNGNSKKFNIDRVVIPSKVKSKALYFEIPKEVLDANKTYFTFNMRGNEFIYEIK